MLALIILKKQLKMTALSIIGLCLEMDRYITFYGMDEEFYEQ
jgi:hypothetical protein